VISYVTTREILGDGYSNTHLKTSENIEQGKRKKFRERIQGKGRPFTKPMSMSSSFDEKPDELSHYVEPTLWQDFLAGSDPLFTNSELLCKHIEQASQRLFSPPDNMRFEILEVTGMPSSWYIPNWRLN
jgi:hypothetical protein